MRIPALIILCCTLFTSQMLRAENMIMARVQQDFGNVMEQLKTSITEHGYTVSHVQRCDGGLKGFGYKTDLYRVIFFGKLNEVKTLSTRHPELVPFLPLKIAVIAEDQETIIVILNPASMAPFFNDHDLKIQFMRWESDIRSIVDGVQQAVR